jgi:hypothetical protein
MFVWCMCVCIRVYECVHYYECDIVRMYMCISVCVHDIVPFIFVASTSDSD